ncbi:25S rRNA (adenine645-N1)-methyltransferase [Friedmanniomyces endolithicus]|uniref:Ribosomal RNA-processing protein 8 n=1 Tax=Friedmanniomyces endolithicus TaxID=329885 RepID=A0AAN6FV02_9PEZI|nr:25S rRNA (adenine645-N1)-methyltransferase [Friedmanniomyces endolithicus]KAK0293890.1 25S rRNA (adenine645-N1)-methyltransferase [Friedmanniomyces endolithicus]KAK0324405.1 25S rRNA (adenine645-N1)-methyltransferase [Friedmanniomyces endolithicus]KAK0991753.1 25S rRNA (adenine645-N1)-methyltransferase [Friedmanniomyces endolithicus]
MFAVKGWSVDASALKTQVAPVLDSTAGTKEAARKDRKRKRGIGGPDKASREDVGTLWEQHIEGKEPVKPKSAERKEKKRRKNDDEPVEKSGQEAARAPVADGQGRADKPGGRSEKRVVEGAAVDASLSKPKRVKKKEKMRGESGEAGRKRDETMNRTQQPSGVTANAPPPVPPLPTATKLTPMQAAMRQKLVSARFRHLNQTLYTAPSATALELFATNPEMFEDYHAGFRQQVDVWPENPLDNFILTIRSRGKVKQPSIKDKKSKRPSEANGEGTSEVQALPRTHGTAIIADLGCGDARLAQTLHSDGDITKLSLKIHSYDLHSPSTLVTKADISRLPLADASADIAIFCLALMGTNWVSFIEEAYRVLHWKGELWIAEIKSRFGRVGRTAGKPVEHSVGGRKKQAVSQKAQATKQREDADVDEQAVLRTAVDGVEVKKEETDVTAFVEVLKRRGFVLKDGQTSVDLGNKMFVKMEFLKAAAPTKGKGVVAEEQRVGAKPGLGKKFVEKEIEEVETEDEAKVLKPCLYKIR